MVSFAYDSGNRLTQAGTTAYTYDVNDNRIALAVSNSKTQYAYENVAAKLSQLLVRTNPDGSQTLYVYGLGLIGQQDSTGYNVYHFDFRGSTVALTNSSGAVTDRFTYGAYGELLTHTGSSDTRFLYNGRDGVLTDANGLYYMRARYYSPELKRFLNTDTIRGDISDSNALNKYEYSKGNPIQYIDPDGKFAWIVAGAVVGAVFGGGSQILSNIMQGTNWYEGVAGATVGGAVNGGILAATGGTSILAMGGAAFAGGASQSIINEVESYLEGQKQLNQSSLESSAQDITFNTAKNGVLGLIGNYTGGKLYFTNSGWFKPQSWLSFLTKSYGQRIISQSAIGSGLSFLESQLEFFRGQGVRSTVSVAQK